MELFDDPDFCKICYGVIATNDRLRVCDCQGIQPYALSTYPGEFCMSKCHPSGQEEQFYKRSEIDPILQEARKLFKMIEAMPNSII